MFAKKVISKDIADKDVAAIMAANDKCTDTLGVLQHHDAVTGTEKQHVADDYMRMANEATTKTNSVYSMYLAEEVLRLTGTKLGNFSVCDGSNNDTVQDCPVHQHGNDKLCLIMFFI